MALYAGFVTYCTEHTSTGMCRAVSLVCECHAAVTLSPSCHLDS